MTPYEQGFEAGEKNDTATRGLMYFGFSCCGDYESEVKLREWLKGFEAGIKSKGFDDETQKEL